MPSRETLTTTSPWPNCEALAVRMVLADPRAAFHPYKCGLCRGIATVTVALIGYDDVKTAAEMTTRRRRSWSTTFSTPTCDYVGSLLQLFFRCSPRLVITIHDLLLTSILGWHSRCSACVAYPLPNTGGQGSIFNKKIQALYANTIFSSSLETWIRPRKNFDQGIINVGSINLSTTKFLFLPFQMDHHVLPSVQLHCDSFQNFPIHHNLSPGHQTHRHLLVTNSPESLICSDPSLYFLINPSPESSSTCFFLLEVDECLLATSWRLVLYESNIIV
jgi:hypothetical protein